MSFRKHLLCVHCSPATMHDSVAALNSHILSRHGFLSSYMCGSCKKVFQHKTSMMRHIRQQHEGAEEVPEPEPVPVIPVEPMEEMIEGNVMLQDVAEDIMDPPEPQQHQDIPQLKKDIKTEAARFLLDLRSSGNITAASVSLIQDYVSKLLKTILVNAKDKVANFLKNMNVESEESEKFLIDTFNLENPFEDLKTTDDQLNFFSENFGLVKPTSKFLDYRLENRLDRATKLFLPVQVAESFQYVSLLETLKLIVRNSYLRELIVSEKVNNDGILRNYKDGVDFKRNRFLQKYPNAVRLVLYQDDLEVSNALGSKDTIHKLGCFYFSVQNLSPEENSLLSSVFLLALTYAEDLKKEGALAKVLNPFLNELDSLKTDTGIEVDLPEGGKFTLRACLVTLTADTLAAHSMMGFMSPSANMFCRQCMLSREDFRKDSTAIGTLRSSRQHENIVKKIERDPALCSKFGVKERSPLTRAMRVPEDSVFDAFHDLVGVIQMIVKLACHEFILVKKLCTVGDLNQNINAFIYGSPDVKNKPSPNFEEQRLRSSGHSLKQYAVQTFCLLRILPFLFDGIEVGNQHLELVFLLQDIVRIIFSFEIREEDIVRLENLVYQHNKKFHELFVSPSEQSNVVEQSDDEDDENIGASSASDEEEVDDPVASTSQQTRRRRPIESKRLKQGINKLHHLMHYPQQIREKGPLIRLWCGKYERRHRITRKHSAVVSNFINIPYTMARHFQLSTFGALLDRRDPAEEELATTGSELFLVSITPYSHLLILEGLQESDQIKLVKSVEVLGAEYRPGLFVALKPGEAHGSQPKFALVLDVLIEVKELPKIFLALQMCQNHGLSTQYNSYEVSVINDVEIILVTLKDLSNRHPMAPWSPVKGGKAAGIFLHPRTVLL